MPNEQYLDTYGLNTFWSQVKSYIDANGGTDIAPGILLYASVAEPIQKNHSTVMTESGFIGSLPNVNDAGYGLLTYDKKLYQVAYHISSIDSDDIYTIVYDSDPLLIGPSEGGGGGSTLLNSINRQLVITQSKWTNVNGVYQCTIPCEGVVTNEAVQNIYSTPAAFQQSDCEEHGVKCIAQGADALTYQAKTLPPDLLMYVTIVNASEMTSDLVEWSPKMTSNTTPAPYVVTYGGLNAATASNTAPFRMFQALPSQSQKPYFQTKTNSFIGIDFGSPIIIYGVSARYIDQQYMPSHYTIQGSSDGLTYFDLFKVVTDSNTSNSDFVRYYFSPVKYRYYRFQMDADTTAFLQTLTECSINSVRFLRPASDVEVS